MDATTADMADIEWPTCGTKCLQTDWSVPNPCPRTTVVSPDPKTVTLWAAPTILVKTLLSRIFYSLVHIGSWWHWNSPADPLAEFCAVKALENLKEKRDIKADKTCRSDVSAPDMEVLPANSIFAKSSIFEPSRAEPDSFNLTALINPKLDLTLTE
ncbi:phosphoenolpyruvate carboxykinase [Striga asiatica]|uniref:Phosphoenolpyruvate carboxykinase n=1 Tax=Striga asiatica TaxID=4170 RepID=A0A5A7NX61_STRAF|nr:phosphoenolpyruvate carboxykinase [Striga asiatica]